VVGIVWLGGIGLYGCGNYGGSGEAFTLEDSAGVVIATSSLSAWRQGEQWSVSEQPSLILGGSQSSDGLWRVGGYARALDGSLAVLSTGDRNVRIFDANGDLLRAIGREGSGPGEFRALRSIAIAPVDTLLVLDGDAIEVFLLDGTWQGSERVDPVANAFGAGTVTRSMMLAPNRSILARVTRNRAGPPRGMQRPEQGLAVLPRPGERPIFLGWYPGLEQQRLQGSMGGNVVPPFARTSVWSVSASMDAQFMAADTDRYEIRVFDGAGSLRRIVRRAYAPVVVKPEWVEEWKENQRGQPWTQRRPADYERVWAEMPVHETLPALEGIAVDSEGYLWVLRPAAEPAGEGDFDIFSPEGRFLGQVRPPSGFRFSPRPLIGENYFVGVWADDMGIESVRVYDLHRGA
jgi:hypothetical protein